MMGRTVIAEESLQDRLTALAKVGTFQIGLLIGQNARDRDYLVHLAPTPIPDEGDLSSEEEDAVPHSPKTEHGKSKVPESISKVVDAIVAQHTRQVVRMLPGGLDVIGLFVVTPQSDYDTSQSQSKIRSILGAVHRTAAKILLETAELRTEKIILHVCTQSFKCTVKTVDVSPTAVGIQNSAELRFHRGGVKWQQISYSYNINLNFWLPKDKSPQSLYKLILSLIKPWAQSVTKSLILIDSELQNSYDFLDPYAEEKQTKKKGSGGSGVRGGMADLSPPKVFTAEILDSGAPLAVEGPGSGLEESSGNVRLAGTVAGLAFVHSKATVGEAKSSVLVDLVRSVVARWEMHCDSLVEEPPSNLVGPIIHEPPRRVFLEGGGLPVSLCDYLFPGDNTTDACQSAKELLGLTVRAEHVDDTLETLADATEVMDSGEGGVGEDPRLGGDRSSASPTCPVSYILLASGVAALGIAFSYVTLQSSKALT
ncbi:protein odr-4 homolog [Penaeus chinensis]|uniref:protein odr-4 homolog n=1 Tax=Penaeus chinensis TaxID=139456 RepID=UPI001FB63623|nr:protein odr-4 homolog [Penaeus chinensis]